MANLLIGWPNRIDEATVAGGSWQAAMPLANVKNRVLGIRARSTDDATSSTKFTINLGRLRPIRGLALANHTLSSPAKVRVVATEGDPAGSPGATLYDSGWLPAWDYGLGAWNVANFEWADERFWAGGFLPEEIEGYRATWVHALQNAVMAQWWQVQMDDTANPAGYVEVGRVFIGECWEPEHNASYGAAVGYESRTEVEEARSGAEYFDRRSAFRVWRGSLDWLSADEAMARAMELDRRMDVSGEVLFVLDRDDRRNMLRTSFLGRLRRLSAIEHPYLDTHRKAVEIKELL